MRATLPVALFFGVAAIGCRSRQPPSPESQPSAPAPTANVSLPSATAAAEQRQVRLVGCRVLAVNGANAKTSGAVHQGRFFDGNAWVELASEVSLSLKHSETTREFAVHGPGRFLVCPSGEESVLVASGVFSSTAGPGSRAGAEVLVGTPLGTLRYGDANLRIDVRAKGLEVNVKQGSALFDRAAESTRTADATQTLEGPKGRVSIAANADAVRLVERCNELRYSVALGRKPTAAAGASAGPLLGSWAATQLKTRLEARLACASARAASAGLEEPERSRLLSLSTSADPVRRADTGTAPDAGK